MSKTDTAISDVSRDYFVGQCGVDEANIGPARQRAWRIVNGETQSVKAETHKLGKLFWEAHSSKDNPIWDLFIETYGLHVVAACMFIYRYGPGSMDTGRAKASSFEGYIIQTLQDIVEEKGYHIRVDHDELMKDHHDPI